MNDIVYILKDGINSEELKYSLRSLENFPHGKVWFFGGCPSGIIPDKYVPFTQKGRTKWEKSTSTFRGIADSGVSDNFWLFNDDFYILKPVESLPYMFKGDLSERVKELTDKYAISSEYCRNLEKTREILAENGLSTLDYALHLPMKINKFKAVEVLDKLPDCPMFRSLYGNYCNVGGIKSEDVKIYENDKLPNKDQILLSTCDSSFRHGQVGIYIRKQFQNPSRWEMSK